MVLIVVFIQLELLDILEVKMTQILHMVFIKILELYKELKQAFIKKELYMVALMEYILMVLLKVILVVL